MENRGASKESQQKMETTTQAAEIRCAHCGKLLAKGTALDLTIKCPRCRAYNTLRSPRSANAERHERLKE